MPMLRPRRQNQLTSPLALMLLGTPPVVLGVAVLPMMLPSALAEERAYLDAPPCPESVTSPREAGECLDRRDTTVLDEEVTGERDDKHYYVTLDFEGGQYRVEVTNRSDMDELDSGDPVTVTSWRGRIREIVTEDDYLVKVDGYPVGAYKLPLMGAVGFLSIGFSLLWMARFERLLKRTGRSIESVGSWTASVPIFTAIVYPVVALIPVVAPPDLTGSLIALGCTTVSAVLVGALLWRRRRRKAERRSARLLSETWVSPPPPRTVIPARVMGEVPYSRKGDLYLVFDPAGLVATPDPRGAAGRSRPFSPLTFVRLHPTAKRDSRLGSIRDPLLLECRDGEREVLIAASRDHVPWVLSRLRLQPQP